MPRELTSGGQDVAVWTFYLFGDLFSTIMVATFFAFLNDSVTSDSAKRLYGVIGFGGVAGGAFGSTTVAAFIKSVSNTAWMFILVAIALVITGIAIIAGRRVDRTIESSEPPQAPPEESKVDAGNPVATVRYASRRFNDLTHTE